MNFIQKPKRKLHHYVIPSAHNDHKPHLVRHKALHFYSALILGVKIFALCFLFATAPSLAKFSTVTSARIIELANKERAAIGASVLMRNPLLDESAMMKAKDMVANNYFSHDSPQGVNPWEWFKLVGYNYTYAGENLAMNFSEAEEAVAAWMASPTHRENMLNKNYDEIGVAVVVGEIDGRQTTVVVQHFGKTFVSRGLLRFQAGLSEEVPAIAGATLIGSGDEIEVTFKDSRYNSKIAKIIFYTERALWIIAIFVLINLLLTVFIRIKIQHKPIILHLLFVLLLALIMIALKLHFLESVVGETVRIL